MTTVALEVEPLVDTQVVPVPEAIPQAAETIYEPETVSEPEAVEVALGGKIEELQEEAAVDSVSELVPEPAVAGTVASGDADLRVRIEETRRRIQEELERPFKLEPQVGSEDTVPAGSTEPELLVPQLEEQSSPSAEQTPDTDRGFDYEDMRRRIEETRNRLKAKAFDAMMSGETALLSREQASGAEAATPAGIPVDADVDRTIEKGLSEEDL